MEHNIRDYFSIIVLTYKKNQTNPPPQKKKTKQKTVKKFNMHRLKCYIFFNLAIKQRDTCIRNIYLKCYIFREILGVSFIFSYIINQKQKKNVSESLPPPNSTIFTEIMYMYLYKELGDDPCKHGLLQLS